MVLANDDRIHHSFFSFLWAFDKRNITKVLARYNFIKTSKCSINCNIALLFLLVFVACTYEWETKFNKL